MTDKEIVKSLRRCQVGAPCARCLAVGDQNCVSVMQKYAADLIERLTAENAKVEAERDAAIADLKISSGCASCKYHCSDPIFCRDCNKKQNCKCMSCSLGLTNWKWHGLPEAPEEGE